MRKNQEIYQMIDKPSDECIEWPYSRYQFGHGCVTVGGKSRPAHRIALEHSKGKSSDSSKRWALHSCNNPPCINPKHLYWGNQKDNEKDKIVNGTSLRGLNNPQVKLTESQVLEIREDTRDLREIALDYGTTYSNVWSVKKRKTWAWLD